MTGDLIERIEAAEAGSRELALELVTALKVGGGKTPALALCAALLRALEVK